MRAVATLVAAACLVLTTSAYVVDEFTSGTFVQSLNSVGQVVVGFDSGPSANLIGGERDYIAELVDAEVFPGSSSSFALTLAPALNSGSNPGALICSMNDGTTGKFSIIWDGPDANANVNSATGLNFDALIDNGVPQV